MTRLTYRPLLLLLGLTLGCGATAPPAIVSDQLPPAREAPQGAERYELSRATATVEVDINGFVSYTLSFPEVTGQLVLDPNTPAESTGEVSVNTRTATTDNDDLGRIARSEDFLDVARYPKAAIEIRDLAGSGKSGEYDMVGVLELHGNRKAISVPFSFVVEPCLARGETAFSVNRREFGVASDTALDSMASDDVEIRVTLTVPRKADGC